MHTLGAAHWLQAWEESAGQPPALAALRLLRAACPGVAPARLASLTPGQRDALLLDLRAALFGEELACTTDCPACAQRLELGFALEALRVAHDAPGESAAPAEHRVAHDGHEVRFRLPDALELARVAMQPDVDAARRVLLSACVIEARRGATVAAVDDLPEAVVAQVARMMAEVDPQAASTLALQCPGCGHAWEIVFDAPGFLCAELDAWARRLLLDVHTLALGYGWTEPEVLALSPARRQAYLDLVAA